MNICETCSVPKNNDELNWTLLPTHGGINDRMYAECFECQAEGYKDLTGATLFHWQGA